MKKYLPSLEEIIPNVIIIVIGLAVWQFVGTPIVNAINSAKSKVSGAAS
jgi:hypothetical protein